MWEGESNADLVTKKEEKLKKKKEKKKDGKLQMDLNIKCKVFQKEKENK